MEPPPGVAPSYLQYQWSASLKMLWGHRKWSARDELYVPRLPDPKSGGSAIPREPRAERMASLTGFAPVISCMRGRHVGWTTPPGQNGFWPRILRGDEVCAFQ